VSKSKREQTAIIKKYHGSVQKIGSMENVLIYEKKIKIVVVFLNNESTTTRLLESTSSTIAWFYPIRD